MLQKIGYSLIDSSNTEIKFWGNTLGTFISAPERVVLSNGTIVEGALPYEVFNDGSVLVERWIESSPVTEIDVKIGETIEFRDDKIVVVYNYEQPSFEEIKLYRKNQVADKRWQVETGGAIIDGNSFATDRESQTKYTAVAVAISQADPLTWYINWKTSDGSFLTLNAQQMMTIINMVLSHVQNSFNKEKDFISTIDSCSTVEEVLAIDINQGWPSNEYIT